MGLPGATASIRVFIPVLNAHGAGAVLDVLSALSSYDGSDAYAVAKPAYWSMIGGIHLELASQNTLVAGVVLGAAGTGLMAGADYDGPLTDAADVARAAPDGVDMGLIEVVVDDWSAHVKAFLVGDPVDTCQPLPASCPRKQGALREDAPFETSECQRRSTVNDTVMIIAESNAAEGKADQVRSLIQTVVERTRAEDGCLRYELLRDLDDDSHMILIEEWRDQASLDAHLTSEHLTTLFKEMMPLLAGEGHGTRVARVM